MSAPVRDPFALGGADPLIALVAARDSIERQMREVDADFPEAQYNAALAGFYGPLQEVEDQIGALHNLGCGGQHRLGRAKCIPIPVYDHPVTKRLPVVE